MAGVRVDVPNGGEVWVNVVGVMVKSKVVEVEAGMVQCVLFFFGRPLPFPTISKTNIYNN